MKPIAVIFLLLFACFHVNAQLRSRLIGRAYGDKNSYDTLYYTYSKDRSFVPDSFPDIDKRYYYFTGIQSLQFDSSFWAYNVGMDTSMNFSVMTYDINNHVVSDTKYEGIKLFQSSVPVQWTMVSKDSFEYNANNGLAASRQYTKNVFPQFTFSSYINGLLDTVLETDTNYNNVFKRKYAYDANNRLLSMTLWGFDNSSWVNGYKQLYSYSGNNQTSVIGQQWDTSGWRNVEMTTDIYTNNNKGEETYYVWDMSAAAWVMIRDLTYTYNPSGNVAVQRYSDWTIQVPVYNRTDSNLYDASNYLTVSYQHEINYSPAYVYQRRVTNTYDAAHNLTEILTELDTGTGYQNRYKTVTIYNAFNQPLRELDYTWNAQTLSWGAGVALARYYYENFWPSSVASQSLSSTDIKLYPSPAQSYIRVELTLKDKQRCTFTITDMQGRLIRLWTENVAAGTTGRSIPVDDLTSGDYVLNITAAREVTAKKFSVLR